MYLKWNENFTLVFLNAYRKHPCLWNPHYVKYYDCLAKNDALKNIINELNIPKLRISDCLEQIKVIREKYGEEQTRVIKGFQSGKPYKSPFAWFPVIAGMLTEVIHNESKLQNRVESVETMSPLKDCITSYDKYKNVSNFPCMQERQDYETKPRKRKNSKFTKTGNLDILDCNSERQYDAQLLHCAVCGWEDLKPHRLYIKATEQACEKIKPLDIVVPCPEYSNLANESYEEYKEHRIADTMCQGTYNNIIPSFPSRLPNCTGYPVDILPTRTYCPQSICNYTNQQMSSITTVTSRPKFCTRETQLLSEQLFPKRTKQVGTSVEQHNKRIQSTVCVSKTRTDIIKCCREMQSKPLTSQEELKQVAANIAEQRNKMIQNTICASLSNSQASQKYSSSREIKQIDANTVGCPANNMRNTIGVKLKTVEGSMPNFILITTDGNYLPIIQKDLKELTTNKCQKDTGDYDQKEVEKACIELCDKKHVEDEVCIKETCSYDMMELIKQNSAVTQALLQCLEKVMQKRTKICSSTSLLSKRNNVNSNSSKATVYEQAQCKFAKKHSSISSAVEIESLSYLPCFEKTEKDDTIAMFTTTFLELMQHALVSNTKMQKGCTRKEDAISTFIVLSKIKECADEILKIYTLADCSKRQLLNKFYCRSKSKSKYPSKENSALNLIQENNKFNLVSSANSKEVEVLYGPFAPEIKDYSLSENGTTYAKTTKEESFMKDKDVTARTENHDIGLTVSLQQISFHDAETQYSSQQLQDTGIVTNRGSEEKISVATQNREPSLIRVIKSNNSEGILKLDKETCVRDAHVLWTTNVDKYSKNMYEKYTVRKYYDELSHPGVSHVREKEVNCINYHKSLLSNGICRHNKGYRSLLPRNHNWTNANISNLGLTTNRSVSRIPLYVKSHMYARRRTDSYRTSQSYV